MRCVTGQVLAISQDDWGVQARRVASVPPPNATHTRDNLVLLAQCDGSELQKWRYRPASSPSAKRMLRVVTCNSSDPYQHFRKRESAASASDGSGSYRAFAMNP